MLGSEEAGLHTVSYYLFLKCFVYLIPHLASRNYHFQRHHVCALIIILHAAVIANKGAKICFSRLFKLLFVADGIIGFAENLCRPYHNAKIVYDECIGNGTVVHRHKFHVSAHCQPVAKAWSYPKIFLAEKTAHLAYLAFNEFFH